MPLEQLAPDPGAFKSALGSVASSVMVITLWDADGRPLGMTATAFSSVSAEPPLILVCVNRSTRSYDHVTDRGHFGVNVLGAAATSISDYCSRPGGDKALEPGWLDEHNGWSSPALSGAVAFLDCKMDQLINAGTHAVIIGAVQGVGLSPVLAQHEPLLFFRGKYRQLNVQSPSVPARPLPITMEEMS